LAARRCATPGSLPFPHLAAGTDTLPGIEHVVVLMLENHSFDNFFGMLGRGDGFTLDAAGQPTATNPYPNGQLQHAFRMPTTCQLPGTPSNEWRASYTAYDNGKNDGFLRALISPTSDATVGGVAMGYWTGDDLPFTYSLAKTFPIGDRWFCSLLGQTLPNRRYLIAGTAGGMTDDSGLSELLIPVPAVHGTIFNQLDNHGISWENYVSSYPTGATPELFIGNDLIPEALHHKSLDDFVADAANGALPSFSFLDPNYDTQSQENPQNIVVGEALLAQVVQRQRPDRLPRPRRPQRRPPHIPETAAAGRPRRHLRPARVLHDWPRHDPTGGKHHRLRALLSWSPPGLSWSPPGRSKPLLSPSSRGRNRRAPLCVSAKRRICTAMIGGDPAQRYKDRSSTTNHISGESSCNRMRRWRSTRLARRAVVISARAPGPS
jgi:hypothetical protein